MKTHALAIFLVVSISAHGAAPMEEVLVPRIVGARTTLAGHPELGALIDKGQQPVDVALFNEGANANARDPFVIKIGSRWHCYYTAAKPVEVTAKKVKVAKIIGAVLCRTSADLKTWSDSKIVAAQGQAGDGLRSAESPHVVEAAPGHYYLFRTQRSGSQGETRVYHSTDPMDFGASASAHGDALHLISTLRADWQGIARTKLEWLTLDQVQPHLAAKAAQISIRVALYDDSGSAGKGVPSVSDQLRAVRDIEVTRLNAEGIRAGLDGYDVVIFTGGSGSAQADAIGLLGRAQVHRFIERGGGYVGICAGAYLACDGFSWGVKVLDARTPSPKWERGGAELDLEATADGSRAIGLPTGIRKVIYHNGPLLVPANNPAIPDFEPLAFFRTEVAEHGSPAGIMVNTPAMVRGDFGKGRVLVSSPHPEQTPSMESFIEQAVRAVAKPKGERRVP